MKTFLKTVLSDIRVFFIQKYNEFLCLSPVVSFSIFCKRLPKLPRFLMIIGFVLCIVPFINLRIYGVLMCTWLILVSLSFRFDLGDNPNEKIVYESKVVSYFFAILAFVYMIMFSFI
jgi:hypothetical protein